MDIENNNKQDNINDYKKKQEKDNTRYDENDIKNDKNELSSIILFVNNKKYLIPNSYLHSHPSGYDSIAKKNNMDCTRNFNFHSKKGQQFWKNFLVDNEHNYIKNNGFDCNIL